MQFGRDAEIWEKGDQHVDAPKSHEQSERAARERDQQRLREKLAGKSKSACSEREAHREIALAHRRSGEKERREIGASEEQ